MCSPCAAGPVSYSGKGGKAVQPPAPIPAGAFTIRDYGDSIPHSEGVGVFENAPLKTLASNVELRLMVKARKNPYWDDHEETDFPGLFAFNFEELEDKSGLVALWPLFLERQGGLWFDSFEEVKDDTLPNFGPGRVWIGQASSGPPQSFDATCSIIVDYAVSWPLQEIGSSEDRLEE